MLTKKEVLYVASLARIHLNDNEVEALTKTLGEILNYIEQLKGADVSSVNPTSHVIPLKNVFRPDQVRPSLKQEDALKLAVAQANGSFKVPQVIE